MQHRNSSHIVWIQTRGVSCSCERRRDISLFASVYSIYETESERHRWDPIWQQGRLHVSSRAVNRL